MMHMFWVETRGVQHVIHHSKNGSSGGFIREVMHAILGYILPFFLISHYVM